MSGGSYSYMYSQIKETYCNCMYDKELNEMMEDLINLLHDLEWWQSADYGEETYRKTVSEFKKKWFKRNDIDVINFIEKEFKDKKEQLLKELDYLNKEVKDDE